MLSEAVDCQSQQGLNPLTWLCNVMPHVGCLRISQLVSVFPGQPLSHMLLNACHLFFYLLAVCRCTTGCDELLGSPCFMVTPPTPSAFVFCPVRWYNCTLQCILCAGGWCYACTKYICNIVNEQALLQGMFSHKAIGGTMPSCCNSNCHRPFPPRKLLRSSLLL